MNLCRFMAPFYFYHTDVTNNLNLLSVIQFKISRHTKNKNNLSFEYFLFELAKSLTFFDRRRLKTSLSNKCTILY